MDEFQQSVLEKLGTIGERLMRLETQMMALPCIADCPRNGNSTKRWLYIGLGIGAGVASAGSAGAAILRALGG